MNCVYLILFLALQLDFIPKFGAAENKLRLEEEERIIGGTLVKPKQFPWITAVYRLKYNSETKTVDYYLGFFQFCGGSLINEHYVLTAAHCMYHYKNGTRTVEHVFGVNDFRVLTGVIDLGLTHRHRPDYITVEKLINHPQFNTFTYLSDIMLLKLPEKITYGDFLKPIAISYKWIGDGQSATMAGWGATCNKNEKNSQLRFVTVRTVASGKCLGKGGVPTRVSDNFDTKTFICAGPDTRFGGGDSGSGLWMSSGRESSLIGIVSHAVPCNSPFISKVPASFTRISHYKKWIKENSKI